MTYMPILQFRGAMSLFVKAINVGCISGRSCVCCFVSSFEHYYTSWFFKCLVKNKVCVKNVTVVDWSQGN